MSAYVRVGIYLALLMACLFVSLYFYLRAQRLKKRLQRSEVNLLEAKERSEESNRLKNAFLANVSHEIRTPLNAIVGFSDVLVTGDSSKEEQQHFFRIIKRNSDLLLSLIDDILDISKLETDKTILFIEECEVVKLAKQTISFVELSKEAGNRFGFKSNVDCFVLQTDGQRMQQVIVNLLSNANKFTKEGTILLEVVVEKERNRVLMSVTDTGCGIPIGKQKQVFERFEKLNEYAQGTGLGLSICSLIVNKWGGAIWVDPSYEKGARLVFSHPINNKIVDR